MTLDQSPVTTVKGVTPEAENEANERKLEKHVESLVPIVLKEWVEDFVFLLIESLCTEAQLQFETTHTSESSVKLEYDIDMAIWKNALQHFPVAQMLQVQLDRWYKEGAGKVSLTERHGRRILECTIPRIDY